jgi:DNA-3-methyladenine glycosylase I
MTYCEYVRILPLDNIHRVYHDTHYGFPLAGDDVLFERLMLEVNQAGLSWETVLKKAGAFHDAFDGFSIDRVAAYGDEETARLLGNAGIIRNRAKIRAAIENARRLQGLRESHGSFAAWLAANHPRLIADWVKLFRATFVFMGPEIVGEFLSSSGYLPYAHERACPAFEQIARLSPPWMACADPGWVAPAAFAVE